MLASVVRLCAIGLLALPAPGQDAFVHGRQMRQGVDELFDGSVQRALEELEAAEATLPGDPQTAAYLAMTHARAGDVEGALYWLEACATRGYDMPARLESVSWFEALNDEPRYGAAIESVRANRTAAIEQRRETALWIRADRAVAQRSWKSSPVQWNDGHTNQVYRIVLSPDGSRALTFGDDLTVRLWDAWLGETLAVSGPYGDIAIDFVDDAERYYVHNRLAGTIELRDGRSGELVAPLHEGDEVVTFAVADPTTGHIVTSNTSGVVRHFDPGTALPAFPDLRLDPSEILHAFSSTDGRTLWTLTERGSLRAHDNESGAVLHESTLARPPTTLYAISARRAWVATLDGHLRLWEIGASRPVAEIEAEPWPVVHLAPTYDRILLGNERTGAVRLYDARTGEEIELAGPPFQGATNVVWSADGSRVTAPAADSGRLWNAQTGELLSELRSGIAGLWFSPDGAWLITEWQTATGILDHWDARTGEALGQFAHLGFSVYDMSMSGERVAFGAMQAIVMGPSGNVPLENHANETLSLALDAEDRVGVASAGISVWELGEDGRPPALATRAAHGWTTGIDAVPDGAGWIVATAPDAFFENGATSPTRLLPTSSKVIRSSPTGELYASAGVDNTGATAATGNVETGEPVAKAPAPYPFTGLLRETCAPAFDPSGELAVTPDGDGALRVWIPWSGEELAVARGHTAAVRHVTFDPTGRYLVSCSLDGTARLWNASDFSERAVLPYGASVFHADFSPDGEQVAVAGRYWVDVFATATGERLHRLERHAAGVFHVDYDPTGARFLSASADGTVRIFDSASGDELAVVRARGGAARYAFFTSDGTRVVSIGRDAAVHVSDAATGDLLVTLVTYGESDWLAFTPGGHYVGTDAATEFAQLALPGGRFPLSSYRTVLNDPAAVAAAVAGNLPPRPFLPEAPEVDLIRPESGVTSQREFELDARIDDRYGIEHVEVYVGGIQVAPEKVATGLREESGGRRARLNLKLVIPPTLTTARVTVRAANARGILSQVAAAELAYEAPRKRLFLLALGVGDYEDEGLRLECPANDVRDLAAAFAAQEGKYYDEVLVESLVDGQVSVAAVERLRSQWLLQAGPDDTIVVFVAGHGVQDDSGEYWFLTPEATADDPYSGINRSNLTRLVTWNKLKTPRRLLMIDTCHSGDAFDATRGEGITPFYSLDDVAALSEDEGAGIYVMAASAESELAREQQGNGLFTRAVLDALAGAADRAPHGNEDGFVDVEEVVRFAKREVHERSNGRQMPTMPEARGGENFRLGRVP